ncbi:hypothetical protein Tco_0336994 [Tanacetum coccineum]
MIKASIGSKSSWDARGIVKSWITCDNTNRNTMLSEAQGVSLRFTSGVRVLKYNWEKILFELDGEASKLEGREEFNDFLTLYPISSKYHVILPKSNQTIFDAPPGLMVVSPLSTSSEGSSICFELYSQLLSEQKKLDSKSFKDKLPPNIEENPMLQRLGRYPTSVHGFPNPILFLMAFRKFIYAEDDEDLSFLPKEPSPGFDIGSSSVSVNTEPLKADEELDMKCKTRGGSSRPPVKRKLALWSSTGRATRAKTSSSKDDVPYLTVFDDDEGLLEVLELKDAIACHLKISAITPPAWKNHLDNHMDVIEKLRVALREMISTPSTKVKEHKVTSLEAKKARLEAIEVSLRKEVKELKQDRREVVSKVVPYVVMELVHSDHMGSLVGRVVSSIILYGRCMAYEQVADIKEPFDLSKVKGYRSS